MNRQIALSITAVAALAFSSMPSARAETKTWVGATGASWSTPGNWSPGNEPTASDDVLFTAGTGGTSTTITNANKSIQFITSTKTTFTITNTSIAASGQSNLTLGAVDASNNLINLNASSGNQAFTISNGATRDLNLILGVSGNFNVGLATGTLSITSAIGETSGGSKGFAKTGAGLATLGGSGDNTYGGTTSVTAGILELAKTNAIAVAGNITIGDGATTAGLDVLRLAGTGGNQIADTSIATFNGTGTNAGTFRLNGQSETVGGIASTGGAGVIENSLASTVSTLTLDVNTTARDFAGVIQNGAAGTLALVKNGAAQQTLSGTVANTYTGLTTVNSGTLLLNKTAVNAVGGNVKIGNGAVGSSGMVKHGASDQIVNTAAVELAGGSLNLNGFSEGTATTGGAGVGALTLTVNSTIDFGAGSNSILHFAGLGTHTAGTVLQIINWSGVPNTGGSGDRLLFSGSASDFTTKYQQSDVSFNTISGYSIASFNEGAFYEVTMTPEPSTYAAGLLALAAVGFTQRKRLRVVLARKSAATAA